MNLRRYTSLPSDDQKCKGRAMFKLENDAQRQRTIERIKAVKTQIQKVRAARGPEKAELYSKAMRGHVADLKEQIRIYDEEKRKSEERLEESS